MAFEQVLKVLKTKEASNYFDLIVLDLNMPVADGYTACRNITKLFESSVMENGQLRSMSDYRPHILAVSSYIDSNIQVLIKEAGFDADYLTPISF